MRCTFSLLLLLAVNSLIAQSLEGLWLVESVFVGSMQMTPQQKWIRIDSNNSFTEGNGWLQHNSGSVVYDVPSKSIELKASKGPKDTMAPFQLADLKDSTMQWTRTEEGRAVQVQLIRISELPEAPAEWCTGLWSIQNMDYRRDSWISNFDQIHLSWTGIFVLRKDSIEKRGYWTTHAHRPEITLIPRSNNCEQGSFGIKKDGNSLLFTNEEMGTFTLRPKNNF